MTSKEPERKEFTHNENLTQDANLAHYTGDHVTTRSAYSPVERSLVIKAGCLFTTLSALVYFVAYLDRNSIGNARIAGMQKSLGLSNQQYSLCVSIFFAGYILFMFPANIILKVIAPNMVVGLAALGFGSLVCGLGGASNYATVVALRFLIGCAQSFIQGMTIYMSFWFRRDEVAIVLGIMYSAATISGAFSGFIAYGAVRNLPEARTGRPAWQWIYIIDGSVALLIGLLVVLLLPSFPENVRSKGKHWLFTQGELDVACERSASFNTIGEKVRPRQILAALTDPKSWAFVVIQFGIATGIGTIGVYLPSFISGFGLSPLRTQLITVIPYACAFATVLGLGIASDRTNKKGPFLCATLTSAIIGYAILLTNASNTAKIAATCLITSGLYPSVILLITWLSINTAGFTKRGTSWAMAEIGGQCMSIMGTHVYDHPPRYVQGHAVLLAFMCTALLAVVAVMGWMKRCNLQKDRVEDEYRARGERHPHYELALEDVQDRHISFRYII